MAMQPCINRRRCWGSAERCRPPLTRLEQAYASGDPGMLFAPNDPLLDPLRGEPALRAIAFAALPPPPLVDRPSGPWRADKGELQMKKIVTFGVIAGVALTLAACQGEAPAEETPAETIETAPVEEPAEAPAEEPANERHDDGRGHCGARRGGRSCGRHRNQHQPDRTVNFASRGIGRSGIDHGCGPALLPGRPDYRRGTRVRPARTSSIQLRHLGDPGIATGHTGRAALLAGADHPDHRGNIARIAISDERPAAVAVAGLRSIGRPGTQHGILKQPTPEFGPVRADLGILPVSSARRAGDRSIAP